MVAVEPKTFAMCKVIQSESPTLIEMQHNFIANLIKKYGGINHGAPFSVFEYVITMIIYFDLPKENLDAFNQEFGNHKIVHS